jgi:hypothetical protein
VASGRGGLRLATRAIGSYSLIPLWMVTMKTTHRLSLDASGVLNIVTTMTCNGSARGTTTTAYKKGA